MRSLGMGSVLCGFILAVGLLGLAVESVLADDPPTYNDGTPHGQQGLSLCKFFSSNCTPYDTTCKAADQFWTCAGSVVAGVKLYNSRSFGTCVQVETGGVNCDYWNPIQCAILDCFFEPPTDPAACTTHLYYIMIVQSGGGHKFCVPGVVED